MGTKNIIFTVSIQILPAALNGLCVITNPNLVSPWEPNFSHHFNAITSIFRGLKSVLMYFYNAVCGDWR
jgi:hypothetical protein